MVKTLLDIISKLLDLFVKAKRKRTHEDRQETRNSIERDPVDYWMQYRHDDETSPTRADAEPDSEQ